MSGTSQVSKKWGDTTSKRGEVSRVFVGNTDYTSTNCEDLEKKFSHYGRISGIDINPNGFSFVQFTHVEDALRAVNGENGTLLKQRKLEVRMFDKSGPPKKKNQDNRGRSRSPIPGRMKSGPTGSRYDGMHGPPPILPDMPGYGRSGPSGMPPHLPPPPSIPGNDIEIIVVNKDQWAYAEMIERRLRKETPVEYIDLLFLHSPQHISMTLNDLFERRTLYAIVVTPINEEHNSCTLHMLHNQTEHRNIPIEEAIPLISRDFIAYMSRNGPGVGPPLEKSPEDPFGFAKGGPMLPPNAPPCGPLGYRSSSIPPPLHAPLSSQPRVSLNPNISNGSGVKSISDPSLASDSISSAEKRLPEEIVYLLRTTLAEGGVQFLSLQQIDSLIEYFSRERDRLTSLPRRSMMGNVPDPVSRLDYPAGESSGYQSSNPAMASSSGNNTLTNRLLENPHVKAALNSLLQVGAIGNSSGGAAAAASFVNSLKNQSDANVALTASGSISTEAPSYMSTSSSYTPFGASNIHLPNPQSHSSPGIGGQSGGPRRHPLFGTELSGPSGSKFPNSMGHRSNNPGGGNRDYPRSSQRY